MRYDCIGPEPLNNLLENRHAHDPIPNHSPHTEPKAEHPSLHHKAQRGQGMTEYIIIVALIAVAAIAVYQFFGQTIRNQTAGIAREVAGQDAGQDITNAQTAADGARNEGNIRKGLGAYTNNNSR